MNMEVTLGSLLVGDIIYISRVDGEDAMKRRLYDIGIREGTSVKCVMISPLGDPKAYEIKGTIIALRKEDSDNIYGIRKLPTEDDL